MRASITVALVNDTSGKLDSFELSVHDEEDCTREVLDAVYTAGWTLRTGDSIVITAKE